MKLVAHRSFLVGIADTVGFSSMATGKSAKS